MRTPAGAVVGLAVLLLLIAVVWVAVLVIQHRPTRGSTGPSWFERWTAHWRFQRRKAARWRPYRRCDPATGDWSIGIELADGDEIFETHRMFLYRGVEANSTLTQRAMLQSEVEAFERATAVNAALGEGS
jgi:hypothetical protein